MPWANIKMAMQERFELPTDGLEGRCSIQLSYCTITAILSQRYPKDPKTKKKDENHPFIY